MTYIEQWTTNNEQKELYPVHCSSFVVLCSLSQDETGVFALTI